MKKISKILGIDLDNPTIIGTFSKAAQGKSTLMAYLIKELHDLGKHVSIISDDKDSIWVSRLANVGCKPSDVKLIYKQLSTNNLAEIIDFIKRQKEDKPYIDCVVLDLPINFNYDKPRLRELIEFIRTKGMMLFTTNQSGRNSHEDEGYSNMDEIGITSDVILSLNKIKTDLVWWKRILNVFRPLFGLPKFVASNVNLSVLKNRRGDKKELDFFMDFEKINKRPLTLKEQNVTKK